MERFDICAEAAPIRYEELRQNAGDNESSAAIRVRVERAREIQAARFDGTGIRFNSRMGKGAAGTVLPAEAGGGTFFGTGVPHQGNERQDLPQSAAGGQNDCGSGGQRNAE